MFSTKKHQIDLKKWRPGGFTFLTIFLAVALFIAGTFEFIPAWILKDPAESIHLWHIAELTALSMLLLGGVMLGLVRHPEEKPLLSQFFVLSSVILGIGIAPFNIGGVAFLVIAGLFVLAYPHPRALLSFKREGPVSKVLLAITVMFAIFLDPVVLQEIHYQIIGMAENDVHALDLHWIGSALLMVLLVIAGVMASTKRPGWKWLGVITGEVYCYLGVIAMITPGFAAGTWGQAAGLFVIFFGALYIMITLAEAQNTSDSKPASVPETELAPETLAGDGMITIPSPEVLAAYQAQEFSEANEAVPAGMSQK